MCCIMLVVFGRSAFHTYFRDVCIPKERFPLKASRTQFVGPILPIWNLESKPQNPRIYGFWANHAPQETNPAEIKSSFYRKPPPPMWKTWTKPLIFFTHLKLACSNHLYESQQDLLEDDFRIEQIFQSLCHWWYDNAHSKGFKKIQPYPSIVTIMAPH